MQTQTVQIELPKALLDRARVQDAAEVRELVAFLLERYAQGLDRRQRAREYESYYGARSADEVREEAELLADFGPADAEADELGET